MAGGELTDAICLTKYKAGMDSLYEKIQEQDEYYAKITKEFSEDLSKIWASGPAYAFSVWFKGAIGDYVGAAHVGWNDMIAKLYDAGKTWSEGNEVEFPYYFPELSIEYDSNTTECQLEIDGIVGMNKDLIMPLKENFLSKCKIYDYMVSSVADIDFAIKDSKYAINEATEESINAIIKILNESLTKLENKIQKEFDKQTESVSLGAELAGKIMEEKEFLGTRLAEIEAEIQAKQAGEAAAATDGASVEPVESTPDPTPTPVVKPSSERPNFDKISFF